ncbi:MAG: DnaD domain protein [SAR202 cluster bacterium]|nr:DnaD domain protein [SAR202 cluster bacterium]
MGFKGFAPGTRATPVPDPLFGSLLEQVQDLAELKVTLRALWLLGQKKGSPRWLALHELLNDTVLLRGLQDSEEASGREHIKRGLALAVGRGVFLRFQPPGARQSSEEVPEREFYLLNNAGNRQAMERWRRQGNPALAQAPVEPLAELPPAGQTSIFTLYENAFGAIGPAAAELLKAVEKEYPWEWISQAFEIAAAANATNWKYVEAILKRWAAEGKDHGEPGRHSPPDNREKYLEEYQRRRGRLPWEPGAS